MYKRGEKYTVRAFTSVENAYLNMLEPYMGDKRLFIDAPIHKKLGLRAREVLGLVLMAHLHNHLSPGKWAPGSDPLGHDGVVLRVDESDANGSGRAFEQVFIPDLFPKQPTQTIEESILGALHHKDDNDQSYTSSTDLVIFANRNGNLSDLRSLAKQMQKSKYEAIYLIAQDVELNGSDELSYLCVIMKSPAFTPGPFNIRISRKTGGGKVKRLTD